MIEVRLETRFSTILYVTIDRFKKIFFFKNNENKAIFVLFFQLNSNMKFILRKNVI